VRVRVQGGADARVAEPFAYDRRVDPSRAHQRRVGVSQIVPADATNAGGREDPRPGRQDPLAVLSGRRSSRAWTKSRSW
jgi:hypothetical protein